MTGDVVITVERLGKSYTIGHAAQEEGYVSLRDVMSGAARRMLRSTRDMLAGRAIVAGDEVEEFRALDEVSFEVRRGDAVGIIGRNGAGKSTLLKVLSRITEPTRGRATIRGRVASLLEVGTGFHPELSGRENIYLNGAILGMTRAEIRRKFDAIVAFAEVERFLDTPVKRYSSGMYVRLAFAVAAHLEPDILIVDEVLAVGDAQFQKKCLGKLNEVAHGGRTVLFVSHNMAAIGALCDKAIYLSRGRVKATGGVRGVIESYVRDGAQQRQFVRTSSPADPVALMSADCAFSSGTAAGEGAHVELELTIRASRSLGIGIDFHLRDALAMPVAFGSLGGLDARERIALAVGDNHLRIAVPVQGLASGSYTLDLDLIEPHVRSFDRVESCLTMDIEPLPRPGTELHPAQSWGFGAAVLMPELVEARREAAPARTVGA